MFQNTTKTFRQGLIGFAHLYKVSPEFEVSASQVLCASDSTIATIAQHFQGTAEKNLCRQETRHIRQSPTEDASVKVMNSGVAQNI